MTIKELKNFDTGADIKAPCGFPQDIIKKYYKANNKQLLQAASSIVRIWAKGGCSEMTEEDLKNPILEELLKYNAARVAIYRKFQIKWDDHGNLIHWDPAYTEDDISLMLFEGRDEP